MDKQAYLDSLVEKCRPLCKDGVLASYIPELLKADPNALGLCLCETGGREYGAGDSTRMFTMQSVSKPLILLCALMDSDIGKFREKVSFEPTSSGFNSIVNLETKNSFRPLNPFINSGAIMSVGFIAGQTFADKFDRALGFLSRITGRDMDIDESVYRSEKATGSRNRALAYFMKSTGVLDYEVEDVLDAYFRLCSISVNCVDLARFALVLANDGVSTKAERLFPVKTAKTVKALMTLCGMYEESGDFAVSVGIPAKSGVGGGIMAAAPGQAGIAVYGPALNRSGSSVAGIAVLEKLCADFGFGIF